LPGLKSDFCVNAYITTLLTRDNSVVKLNAKILLM